jgi:hypothetical protein
MGAKKTNLKTYPISVNGEDPGTTSVPEVKLLVEPYASNRDKFNIVIVIVVSIIYKKFMKYIYT